MAEFTLTDIARRHFAHLMPPTAPDPVAEARKLVATFMAPGRVPVMDPAYLHAWGAGNTARSLEKALALLAEVDAEPTLPACPDCDDDAVVETSIGFDRVLNCEGCGCCFTADGEIVAGPATGSEGA